MNYYNKSKAGITKKKLGLVKPQVKGSFKNLTWGLSN